MNSDVQCIVLECGLVLISQIESVVSELGEPDCKLINPYLVNLDGSISKWLDDITDNIEVVMISSDKILTLVDPKQELLNSYLEENK